VVGVNTFMMMLLWMRESARERVVFALRTQVLVL
jgi:hypothetical protein